MSVRRVLVACGTRPEFVKLAPVVRALGRAGLEARVVATGQHHDPEMAGAFFAELGLEPSARHDLPGDEPARLGALVEQAERELAADRPDLVLLLGDTNTVPAYALAARRRAVPVAHLEAGLRSFNPTSMEEVNRRVAAATASLQLAPTDLARRFLLEEGVDEASIEVVGNPVVDVLVGLGVRPRPPGERAGVLFTAHRATNVDDPDRLRRIVSLACSLAHELGPVTFPVHPRTRARLEAAGLVSALERPGLVLRPPVGYGEMLSLLSGSAVAVTDSGGVQEEASYFGVPVVVLRHTTPRWEGVLAGTSALVGLDVDAALGAAASFADPAEQERVAAVPCPYGDGRTGERVAALLTGEGAARRLEIREPPADGSLPAPVRALLGARGAR